MASLKKTMVFLFCILFLQPAFSQAGEGWKSLFDGKTLKGWQQIQGAAIYTVDNGAIEGTSVQDTINSFLVTDNEYSNFALELDFKVDEGLNSGVQIRSNKEIAYKKGYFKAKHHYVDMEGNKLYRFQSYKHGVVHGYQVEIDPAKNVLYSQKPFNYDKNGNVVASGTRPRDWTGGIYDEKRRAWIYPLTHNEEARNAFKPNQWNHFRIEAVGDSIKTWINGVPAANLADSMTSCGFIGFQVHETTANKPMHVWFKNIKIKNLDE